MVGRSRTGCLTCRQRKLKCGEEKPVCANCEKAKRECVPSGGIVFRHQQNASMNSTAAEGDDSLQRFYAYKNTFEKDNKWVNIPNKITFLINPDPDYDYETNDPTLSADASPNKASPSSDPVISPPEPRSSNDATSDNSSRQVGLEALSNAASSESYHPTKSTSTSHPSSSLASGTPRQTSETMRNSGSPHTHSRVSSQPTPNLTGALINNPPPGIPPGAWEPILSRSADLSQDSDATTKHEVAFLLRHFSESLGQWMDLFDLSSYFACYVPVKAMTNPLLKNAACAFAAKQLGRVRGRRPPMGGCFTSQGASELFPDIRSTDWSLKGSQYYDAAIGSLRDALKDGIVGVGYNSPEEDMQRSTSSMSPPPRSTGEKRKKTHDHTIAETLLHGMERRKSRKISTGRALSDEMAAATAILCNYELLEGSGTAWLRHLDGTKTLLDVVEGSMRPLQAPWVMPRPPISRARQATFWNFARQDFLSALINETQTRLDTEDLKMWRDAGIIIDEDGFISPSNTSANGLPEAQNMKEDMISNGLIWIMAKIVNYAVAADTGPGGPHRESWLGINQATLFQTWEELHKHLAAWYAGLPDTFRPCAHLSPNELSGKVRNGAVFSEVWYNIPMCASTMQWYHMARMLLLLNQPQQSTMGKTTFFRRFGSYKSITTDIEHHGRAICSIAASRPDAAVRIHSVQPLYTAGQSLELPEERSEVIRLLKEIQDDTGWATDYRVQQLLQVWNWPESYGF